MIRCITVSEAVFTEAGIETIESLQADWSDGIDADTEHNAHATTDIGPHETCVRTPALTPGDTRRPADELAAIALNPSNRQ